jgi:hypothetical protein
MKHAPRVLPTAFTSPDPAERGRKEVFFVEPRNGDVLPIEFWVILGARGLNMDPERPGAIRLHLLIDQAPADVGEPIEAGAGRIALLPTWTRQLLMLPEGPHLLCAQAADLQGRALDVWELISVEVSGD